jgi:flagellin
MAMTINTNVMSLNAQRNVSTTNSSIATSMQRLSSGLRVNSAKDDAAGLAIAERMTSQIRGSNVAIRNANDAISMFQTAEGAMAKIQDNLQRIRELAVQSANGALSDNDRATLQTEVDQLTQEISRVVQQTKFNGTVLFDDQDTVGTGIDPLAFDETLDFQVGANEGDTITVNGTGFALNNLLTGAYSDDLTATGTVDISDATAAAAAISAMDDDIDAVSTARSTAGGLQSRFEAVVSQLQILSENTSAARGRIMDADFAQETANLSRAQILQQAGSAMVAQANQAPQQVLALLRNF